MTEHANWCWLTHQKIALDKDRKIHDDGSECTCSDDLLAFAGYAYFPQTDSFRRTDGSELSYDEAKAIAENMHKIRNRHRVGSRTVTLKEFE